MRKYLDFSFPLRDPRDPHWLFRFGRDTAAAQVLIDEGAPTSREGRRVLSAPVHYELTDGVADLRAVNDFVLAQPARAPWIEAVFGVVEIPFGEAAILEMDRIASGGARGLVWSGRAQGVFINHPAMPDLCRRAHDMGLVSLFTCNPNTSNDALWRIWSVAERCEGIPLVVTGALSMFDHAHAVVSDRRGGPANVIYDTAGWSMVSDLPAIFGLVGPERLVFGSGGRDADAAAADMLTFLGTVEASGEAAEAIFWCNAARLLGLGARGENR